MKAVAMIAVLGLSAGCIGDEGVSPEAVEGTSALRWANDGPLSVFVLGNEADRGSIIALRRRENGRLSEGDTFPTGGLGSGMQLGSQGAIVLTQHGRLLLAVNAGSDEVSLFEVRRDYLVLRDIVPSGGLAPISLTVDDDRVYVLNAGDEATPGNISGFMLAHGDRLVPIDDSTRPLSGVNTQPAQVSFSPDGGVLVVTEKAANNLLTYVLQDDGTTSGPIVTPSNGQTPFGFDFDDDGLLVVSEAFGGAEGASALSSYRIADDGVPEVVSGSVSAGQTAACWVEISRDGRTAWTTNTGSDSISGFSIRRNGTLTPFDDDGVTALPGGAPIDLMTTPDGRFLYALNGDDDTIAAMRVRRHGELEVLDHAGISGLPASAVGIAIR